MSLRLSNSQFPGAQQWLRNLLAVAALLVCRISGLYAQEHIPAAPPAQEISQPIRERVAELNHGTFRGRLEAQEQLFRLTEEHPEQLEQLAREFDGEVGLRMVRLLERIFLQHDDALGERAEQALQRLESLSAPIAIDARAVLVGNARTRESRARRELEKLGVEFVYVIPTSPEVARAQITAPETGVGFGEPAVLHSVWMHEDWTGERSDLWHFTRLAHIPDLRLYKYFGVKVPLDDLLQLGIILPGLTVSERGPCLGIRQAAHLSDPVIEEVMPGGAAEKAGLLPNDRIRRVNENEVSSFTHLVEILSKFEIGDEVAIEVERGRARMKVPVTLCSWRGVLGRDERNVPSPTPFYGPFDQQTAAGGAASPPQTPRKELE